MEMPYLAEYMTESGVAAVLRSGVDGGQDTPPSSLPENCDEYPVSAAVGAINAQVHTTLVEATEQAARRRELPSTTLPAPT